MTKEQILQQAIQARDFPTLPAVACKVLALTADEEMDLKAVARAIAEDVSLASKILRAVNSPLYGIPRSIGTISQAIARMGSNAVRGLTLTFALIDLRRHCLPQGFDYDRFWQKSLMTAVLARRISRELPSVDGEEAFVAGLMANIGEMLLARSLPERYQEVLQFAAANELAVEEAEQHVLGTHHGEFGAAVARHWRFPDSLCEIIGWHARPGELNGKDPGLKQLAHTIHLGDVFARMLHGERLRQDEHLHIQSSQRQLGLDRGFLQRVAPFVHEEMALAAEFFGLRLALAMTAEEILQEANQRLGQMHLANERRNAELDRKNRELEEKGRVLQDLANIDGLTQTYNHRYFQEFLKNELNRANRSGQCLSLLLADIDGFKFFNDSYGHLIGDAVLREFCRVVSGALREYDLMARYGGEEFTFVLPNTSAKEARNIAERIRLLVESHTFSHENLHLRITISLGVATQCPAPGSSLASSQLIDLADRALLQAKLGGKNQVHVSAGP